MTGVTPIKRKTKDVYQIAFSFMGVECREVRVRPHCKASEMACMRERAAILHEIELGTFNYGRWFPDSKRAAIFGHGPGRTADLKQHLEAYRDRVSKTLEPSTYAGYRRAIDNYLVPWFGHFKPPGLKPSDIRERAAAQTFSLKRLRNLMLPLRAVLDELMQDQVIAVNPLRQMDLAKLVPVDKRTSDFEPRPYTEDELRAVLGNLAQPDRWAFQAWAYTGMRTGELIGLRWPRVDLEVGVIHIQETTTMRLDKKRPKTKAGVRDIPLLPAAREAFEGMRQHTLLGGDRVTVNERSTREDRAWTEKALAKVWKKAHAGTKIPYRNPYELRHTFASQLLSQGENPAYISTLLGHATVEMVTRVYGRFVKQGEALGFDRPPRRYGRERLWSQEATGT